MPTLSSQRQFFIFLDESQAPGGKSPFFFVIEKGKHDFTQSENIKPGATPNNETLNTSDAPTNERESTLNKVGSVIFWLGLSCVVVATAFYF
jgi:hypothetical protein